MVMSSELELINTLSTGYINQMPTNYNLKTRRIHWTIQKEVIISDLFHECLPWAKNNEFRESDVSSMRDNILIPQCLEEVGE